MNSNIKKVSILIICIILIIVIMIAIILSIKVKEKKEAQFTEENTVQKDGVPSIKVDNKKETKAELEETKNKLRYYAVKNIIEKYAYNIMNKNNEIVYDMIDKDYILENEITVETVLQHVENCTVEEIKENSKMKINIDKMYEKKGKNYVTAYIVYGEFCYENYSKREKFNAIVELDTGNMTFGIIPTKKVTNKYPQIENFSSYNVEKQEIEQNEHNRFVLAKVYDDMVIIDYIGKYKNAIVEDVEKAYNLLDEEYRNKRFQTLDNYKRYIEKNRNDIFAYTVAQYKVEKENDTTKYICKDKNENYYIFEESAVMNYKLKLDNYTIETENFKNAYDSANEQNKVAMNIQKWISMINNRDYHTAYSVLDETFRNDNFGSEERFEEYMREIYPEYYDIKIKDVKKESNAYVAQMYITQKSEKLTFEAFETTIMMQLKDNREFKMSFSIRTR